MLSKTKPELFLLLFLGGAIGATARYAVELSVSDLPSYPLIATSIVNLLGALALGVANGNSYFTETNRRLFYGVGLLGSFTTTSGLAAISAGADLGLGASAPIYWLFVLAQLVVGVLLYGLGLKLGGLKDEPVS